MTTLAADIYLRFDVAASRRGGRCRFSDKSPLASLLMGFEAAALRHICLSDADVLAFLAASRLRARRRLSK